MLRTILLRASAPAHPVRGYAAPALLLLLLPLLLLPACSNWPPEAAMLHADYDTYTPGWDEADQSPRLASDGGTTWLVAWAGRSRAQQTGGADCPTGATAAFEIYTARSTDAGKSWQLPKCLDVGTNNGLPSLAGDGKGNWVIAWQASGGAAGTDGDVWTAFSTNATWGKAAPAHPWTLPTALNTNAMTDSGLDAGPEVAWDGTSQWVAVWTSRDPLGAAGLGTDADVLFATSSDGTTWSAPQALNTNAATDSGDDGAPFIASDGKGNLVVVWQSTDPLGGQGLGTDPDILFSRSVGGQPWTAPLPLNTNAATDAGLDEAPRVAWGAGRWNAVWASTDPLGGTLGTDYDILVSHATGTGTGWQAPRGITPAMAKDNGDDRAPSVAYGKGRWVAVWHSDEPSGATSTATDDDVRMASSRDGGTTWERNGAINAFHDGDTADDARPHAGTDGKGTWVVVWDSDHPGGSGAGWGLDDDILTTRFTIK